MERHVAERPPDQRSAQAVPDLPTGRPDPELVPDVVLDEVLAAFSQPDGGGGGFDFDDPSIDRLLGLGDDATDTTDATESSPPDDTDDLTSGESTSSETVALGA